MKRILITVVFILAASVAASAQSFTYYFAQIAAGDGWRTTIFASNATSDTVSTGTITFTTSSGAAFAANWLDEMGNNVTGGGNVIWFQLAPGHSRKYTAVGDLPLTVGYAKVAANASVLGTAMFSRLDDGGNVLSEAGLPMAIPLGKQAIFVDTTAGFRTALAIANPNTAVLHIHLQLVDDTGHVLAQTVRDLPSFQHAAFFTDELFPGASPMVGRLQFWCTNPIVSVALRFSPTLQFTTMAPIAIGE